MEIRSLELENCKSYEHETVVFARGTNAICGPNGAGKSTILEAIGYALFDEPPCRPIGNFVREGCKTATITVVLAAADEREYHLIRKCGAQNQYYVYDPELGQKVAESTQDVGDWLKEQFGAEDAADLPLLFRDAVGVPQGLLTAAFLQTAKSRQAVFNPLLRIEEYNQAFAGLLDTKRALDGRLQGMEKEIAGLQAEVKALPGLEQEASSLAAEIQAAKTRLAELAPELAALEERKQTLTAARDHLRRQQEESARLDERIAGHIARLQQAQDMLEQARAAGRALAESEAGYRAYLAARAKRQALEAQERARAELRASLQGCRAGQKAATERIADLQQGLQATAEAESEAQRLQPLVQEQERLERELLQATTLAQQWKPATRRLEQERARLAELAGRLQQVITGLAAHERLEREREQSERELWSLDDDLRSLQARQATQSARLEQLRTQSEALAHVEGARCPTCESELSAERQAELLEANRREVRLAEDLLAELASQQAEITSRSHNAAQTLRRLQREIGHLPRPGEEEALQSDCQHQEATIREAEAEAARLAEAHSQSQVLEAKCKEIGNPRAAYQRASALAAQRPAIETALADERSRSAALAAELAGHEERLAAYAALDSELASVQQGLKANELAYQRYLQHQRQAEELPQRSAQLSALQTELREAEVARQTLEAELALARAAYRQEDDESVTAAYLQVSKERSRLQVQVDLQSNQLQSAHARIEELQAATGRLQATEHELAGWQETGHLLEYLRRVLKEAGPQVTRVLVEVISLQAARLYADIVNDQSGRLRWSEDYEILLETRGYDRTFQQLSGGEQMAAALAVRLALLRETSDIDIAFFDEPTSNLDDTRRDNLADQILAVKGFSQLFVVSHDDTFERTTDHVVRVVKEDGRSKVAP